MAGKWHNLNIEDLLFRDFRHFKRQFVWQLTKNNTRNFDYIYNCRITPSFARISSNFLWLRKYQLSESVMSIVIMRIKKNPIRDLRITDATRYIHRYRKLPQSAHRAELVFFCRIIAIAYLFSLISPIGDKWRTARGRFPMKNSQPFPA